MRWMIGALIAVLMGAANLWAADSPSSAAVDTAVAETFEGTFEVELAAADGAAVGALLGTGKFSGRWRVTRARPPATEAAPFPQPVLQVVVVPSAKMKVDDRELGEVSARQVALAAGKHVVELRHPGFRSVRRTITLLPGQTQRLVVDLAEEAVRARE